MGYQRQLATFKRRLQVAVLAAALIGALLLSHVPTWTRDGEPIVYVWLSAGAVVAFLSGMVVGMVVLLWLQRRAP